MGVMMKNLLHLLLMVELKEKFKQANKGRNLGSLTSYFYYTSSSDINK
jgi:hypothetical protein